MKNSKPAIIALLLVQLFYGVTFTFANDVIDGGYIQPYGFILFRISLAAVLFWVFSLWTPKEKIDRKDYPKFMIAAFFGVALNMLAFFKGLQFTTPINGSVIMVTTPIIVLVLSAFIFKEKITRLKVLGIIAGLSGALILSTYTPSTATGDNVLLGNLLVLVNAASYSYYLILIKKITNKYHPYTFIKWLFLFGTLFVLPFGYSELAAVNWSSFTPYIWFSIFFVVVCATFATYLLNPIALRKLSATTVSTFVYVQPIFAGIFAIMMGSDQLSIVKVVAASLIFLGVYLVSKTPNPHEAK
ncbi:DMT family transporter [Flavobacteriaceae bacterium]|nr:DMT family transporter [Flavobacteriaceae bacterium]